MNMIVKCTRCKNMHPKSERIDIRSKKDGSVIDSTCPRCACRSFYDMTEQVAWCWATGLIEIGDAAPADNSDGSGCIEIAHGPRHELERAIDTLAHHGYEKNADKTIWLVPGVPEADDADNKIDALNDWLDWCIKGGRKRARNWPRVIFSMRITA